ncbi:Protein of unknown function [Gryllus bimaculatus]|nr:Protein of unknown function [Gryllus bimaculatus]
MMRIADSLLKCYPNDIHPLPSFQLASGMSQASQVSRYEIVCDSAGALLIDVCDRPEASNALTMWLQWTKDIDQQVHENDDDINAHKNKLIDHCRTIPMWASSAAVECEFNDLKSCFQRKITIESRRFCCERLKYKANRNKIVLSGATTALKIKEGC